ncbi:DEKNAAC102032 [Brettanomyces naardenensis]|uniref:DEKNAAC102032 n=1 Tax=Brettanomyces naardenensis TaxID=13370 RepID=A0A448YJL5_BRENA|nr:DEKNAAC102032 [Brettanomyces naardenensis]
MEKDSLPVYQREEIPKPHSNKRRWLQALSVLLTTAVTASWAFGSSIVSTDGLLADTDDFSCLETPKLVPSANEKFYDISEFRSNEYKNYSLEVWADSVRVVTPSFDDLGPVGEDPRWEVFYEFEEYLNKSFPVINKKAELVHVNTHGLVYIIHGEDESLKPVLLTGHQDVVPVPDETVSRWTYPPFEGHFDGQWLWGRGSGDDKDSVVAIFEATEKLLSQGFQPKRTLVIALGFDEESSGVQGAISINKYLLNRFGKDSFFFLVDEGGLGIQDIYGGRFALPSTGEKGYVDVTIDLITSGGHSSIPPRHTAIGILSELITLIESKPYPLRLSEKNPLYHQLQCEAKRGPEMNSLLRESIKRIDENQASKDRVLDSLDANIASRYLASTSQAIDIIKGGLKINALPEKVTVKINHRVSYDSSIDEVKEKILEYTKKVAEKYDLGVEAYGVQSEEFSDLPSGYFKLTTGTELPPAPVTVLEGNPTWNLLAGTIRHVFEDFAVYPDADPKVDGHVTVSPSVMTGNTDTRHYWSLTSNIYRFSPGRMDKMINIHAIDERVDLDAHVEGVAFFYQLLRNVYEYDTE